MHVAIIPDGNRRWAKRQNKESREGHFKGGEALLEIVRSAKPLGIKLLTFYAFSTENWQRDPSEVYALMGLLDFFLKNQQTAIQEHQVHFDVIGDLSPLPDEVKKTVEKTKTFSKNHQGLTVIFAINYGGRSELERAAEKKEAGKPLADYLDTKGYPDPDLLIRTGGEYRLSNFLLWQLSYTELYFTPILWPDFTPHHFQVAIDEYQQRERRGGL